MKYVKLFFEKRKLAQEETPASFFEHVRGDYAFLLESGSAEVGAHVAVGGSAGQAASGAARARYSYIGYDPYMVCSSTKGVTQLLKRRDFLDFVKKPIGQIVEGAPVQVLRDIFKSIHYHGSAPVPFFGGAAGFFTYDFGADLMEVKQRTFDDFALPDFVFAFVDKVIAFDHQAGEFYFLALAETDLQARKKIETMKEDLQKPVRLRSAGEMGELKSNLSANQYKEKIAAVKQYLKDGETYQVNFSQRFTADSTVDGWKIFKKLSRLNPSPFSCYFEFPEFKIISSSPELLLRKKSTKVETWPIKGTVARGKNSQEDTVNEAQLLASEKDKAELAMITDLARNDLGKVCEAGSVKVSGFQEIEKYSHVIHTIARVEGKMAYGKDFWDAFMALFPGGSITGCPKKRTMEIIDRLEDFKRGVYTGSAGFVNLLGDGDLNILIRTILQKNGKIYFQAGGGIVADSDSKKEYEESLMKGEALSRSLKV